MSLLSWLRIANNKATISTSLRYIFVNWPPSWPALSVNIDIIPSKMVMTKTCKIAWFAIFDRISVRFARQRLRLSSWNISLSESPDTDWESLDIVSGFSPLRCPVHSDWTTEWRRIRPPVL